MPDAVYEVLEMLGGVVAVVAPDTPKTNACRYCMYDTDHCQRQTWVYQIHKGSDVIYVGMTTREPLTRITEHRKGVAQNGVEAGAGYYRDTQHIVTEVFDSSDDDTWLISEKGKKVTKL